LKAHAALRDAVRRLTCDVGALEAHAPAGRRDRAGNALERGRLARAVAPQQRDQLGLAHGERHALQHMALAVVGVQAFDFEDVRAHRAAFVF
jgi:hypothetical protein